MFDRIIRMMIKEFIQVFRDPRTRLTIFLMPLIQLFIFGYAVTTDVRHVPVAVYDLDNSVTSRDLIARFVNSGCFDAVEYVEDDERAAFLVNRGDVTAILHIRHGFEGDLQGGRTAEFQVIVDGTDSNSAGIVLQYAAKITGDYSKMVLVKRIEVLTGVPPVERGVDLRSRAWFNSNLVSRNFFVPGVIAMLVMLATLILTSLAVVREKEIGTIEQILVTPITPTQFILGKTLPFAIIGLMDMTIVLLVGVFWFDVPIRGSVILLYFCTLIYLMTSLGAGLIISTISRTQQQASMTVFLFFFPVNLLSGFMFPIENMPKVVQWFTYLNPLRYFIVIVRGIFLKGVGVEVLWPEMLALVGIGVTALFIATRRFRKTMG